MNSDKQQIFNYIKHDTPELISYTLIKNYLKKYPGDIDIITIKAYIDMLNDNIDSAISTLDFVLKKALLMWTLYF